MALLFDELASLKIGDVIIGELSIVFQSNWASAWLSIDCNMDWRLCGLISDGAVVSYVIAFISRLASSGAVDVTESTNDIDEQASAEVVSKFEAEGKLRSIDCTAVARTEHCVCDGEILAFVDVCNILLQGMFAPTSVVEKTELLDDCETWADTFNDEVGSDALFTIMGKGSVGFAGRLFEAVLCAAFNERDDEPLHIGGWFLLPAAAFMMLLADGTCCWGTKMFNEEFVRSQNGLLDIGAVIAMLLLNETEGWVNWVATVEEDICGALLGDFREDSMEMDAVEFVCTGNEGTVLMELVSSDIDETAAQAVSVVLLLPILLVEFWTPMFTAVEASGNLTELPTVLLAHVIFSWESWLLVLAARLCGTGVWDVEAWGVRTRCVVAMGTDKFVNMERGSERSWFGARRTTFPATNKNTEEWQINL